MRQSQIRHRSKFVALAPNDSPGVFAETYGSVANLSRRETAPPSQFSVRRTSPLDTLKRLRRCALRFAWIRRGDTALAASVVDGLSRNPNPPSNHAIGLNPERFLVPSDAALHFLNIPQTFHLTTYFSAVF